MSENKLVLNVDDSKLSRVRSTNFLKNNGYEVFEAANGIEALEQIEKQIPDCIVLDLLMPEMDGFGVLENLKLKGLDIPVLICSADIQKTSRDRCMDLGAKDILGKPLEEDKLVAALSEIFNS